MFTHFIAQQMKDNTRNIFAIHLVTMEIMNNFCHKLDNQQKKAIIYYALEQRRTKVPPAAVVGKKAHLGPK